MENRKEDALSFALGQQREKFRVEIRRSRVESCLNGKRFQSLPFDYLREGRSLRAENQDLPSLEVSPQ